MGRKLKNMNMLKICQNCGKKFGRKKFGNRYEDNTRFMLRKNCGQSCGNTKANPNMTGFIKRASYLKKESCEICGKKRNLHTHHIDQNVANNAPENLRTLCSSCHIKHHWRMKRLGLEVGRRYCNPNALENKELNSWEIL